MTISAVVPDIAFAGSSGAGTMGPFSLLKSGTPLVFFNNSEVVVLRYDSVTDTTPTLLVEGTDYTLTGGPTAGSLTLIAPQTGLLTAERLYVTTLSALAQSLDLVNGGNFSSSNLERRLDVIFQILQQHAREIKSTIRFAMFDTDNIPGTVPIGAALDKIPYITGTASNPSIAFINDADTLGDFSQFTEETLADIAVVAADLSGADTIGIVAASIDDVEDVAAALPVLVPALADIETVADALNAGELVNAAGCLYLSSYGTTHAGFVAAVAAAKAAGKWLDCEHATVTLTSLLNLTGAGVYKWKNLFYEKLTQTATDFEQAIKITGPGFDSPKSLSANASVGATSVTFTSAVGLAAGDTLYLMHDSAYAPAYTPIKSIATGEYITLKAVNTGTGVCDLSSPLQSSYTTGNAARAYKFNRTCEIWMKDVQAKGGGVGLKQGGMQIIYGTIKHWEDMRTIDNEYQGFDWQVCVDEYNKGTVYSEGALLDGYGYGQVVGGCLNPQFLSVTGKESRHMITGGGSLTLSMPGGTNLTFMGQGGDVRKVDCVDARGDPFDVHFGERGFKVGAVGGNMVPGTGESCFTIQSPDVIIESYNVTGGDQGGIIQSWGKPSDEPAPVYQIGKVNLGRGGSSTNRALLVENLDSSTRRPMRVSVDSFAADYPGLLVLDPEQGNIEMFLGYLAGTSRTTHTIEAISSANGQSRLTVAREDTIEDSGNASIYAINANGDAYETANPGAVGVMVDILSGRIVADNTAYYANDATIRLGPGVGGTTTQALVGIGTVRRPGEVKSAAVASGSAVALTTGVTANVTSLSLEPGVWLVDAQASFSPAGTTSITNLIVGVNTASATIPAPDTIGACRNQQSGAAYVPGVNNQVLGAGSAIITVTTTTTVYLVVQGAFTIAALSAFGKIQAQRLA